MNLGIMVMEIEYIEVKSQGMVINKTIWFLEVVAGTEKSKWKE